MRTLTAFFFTAALAAADRQVAITIDDLPVAQSGPRACEYQRLYDLTSTLLVPFRQQHVPLTAFLITGNCPDLTLDQRRTILGLWTSMGAEIGNHTHSHRGLNTSPIAEYEQDILTADGLLRQFIPNRTPRFFRSPMLQAGTTPEDRDRLGRFLAAHGYRQAAVTFDNSDWMFAYVYSRALDNKNDELAAKVRQSYIPYLESVIGFFEQRSVEVVGREFPQVLLLHANRLNQEMGGEILKLLSRRYYHFVTLEQALRDPAYSLPNGYAGKGGFSWIHRWAKSKGMASKGEPDEPQWLTKAYESAQ